MLDALSDFWKPIRKAQMQEKLQPDQLQAGSSIVFGFVPQAYLSGRRLQVASINTYRFGEEKLTSFVLSQDKEQPTAIGVSMIIAESVVESKDETPSIEQYLAISRRMTISERMKMFDSNDLENVIEKADAKVLPCRDGGADFKGWTVASYKRGEQGGMQGAKGIVYKGDFRRAPLPAESQGQEFKYTLLISDNSEHAIEIEKYNDGRVEVYATIYRRLSDVGEVSYSPLRAELTRPDLKLATKTEEKSAPTEIKPIQPANVVSAAKSEPVKLQEFPKPVVPAVEAKPATPAESFKPMPVMQAQPAAKPIIPTQTQPSQKETKMPDITANGHADKSPAVGQQPKPAVVQSTVPESFMKQEVKAVTKTLNGLDNDAIECDLRVANKIIDEAIRNEMRLSDIVRRIIELPVAHQEAVHIPVTLSDEDFSLLAIRYGISSSDRNSIKRRIMEELNDFSGPQKQPKAA